MRKILATISYDGTNYSGWQKQKNSATIQQELEKALEKLAGKHIEARGASRTDAGVHALGQRAAFELDMNISEEKIPFALNSMLPRDICVTECIRVNDEFHPQYDVVKKTYEYNIYNAKFRNPLYSRYSAFVYGELNFERIREGCRYFLGKHDFRAFCAAGSNSKTTVREIYDIYAERNESLIRISVTGNGFLYNMVRIIAGTLIDVGQGRIETGSLSGIISSGERSKAGQTAPPQGLVLKRIYY